MESVPVEIFGQTYSIKGKDPASIRKLAAFVDAKMKEVQKATGTADPHRVAILAALMISDELQRVGEQHAAGEAVAEKALSRLLDLTRPPKPA